jgi:hypothetical protein
MWKLELKPNLCKDIDWEKEKNFIILEKYFNRSLWIHAHIFTRSSIKSYNYFYFQRPKLHYYKNDENVLQLKPNAPLYCMSDGDIDNLVKLILDVLNQFLLEL